MHRKLSLKETEVNMKGSCWYRTLRARSFKDALHSARVRNHEIRRKETEQQCLRISN